MQLEKNHNCFSQIKIYYICKCDMRKIVYIQLELKIGKKEKKW